jgi:hypothetical protein
MKHEWSTGEHEGSIRGVQAKFRDVFLSTGEYEGSKVPLFLPKLYQIR